MRFALLTCLLATLLGFPPIAVVEAQDDPEWTRLVDLRGKWQFAIGDEPAWADPDFDDYGWTSMFVPSKWEDEGFFGYDGYAWYRTTFAIDARHDRTPIYLHLGRIDDVDAVYVNGQLVGSTGSFPPDYQTGYHHFRAYRIPADLLRFDGPNVIAVRVFDESLGGGIVEGDRIGLFAPSSYLPMVNDLAGMWHFKTGDQPRWADPALDDASWAELMVPMYWERQGYEDYSGFAWYRKTFVARRPLPDEPLVLVLGKIDDLDEVYLNGRRIGGTGDIDAQRIEGDEWQRTRIYPIPPGLLKAGKRNVLAVRVFDGLVDGGMHEGPVGIATQRDAERWTQPPAETPFSLYHLLRKIWQENRE